MKITGKYFYGNEVSAYGQEHGFLDYGTLSKAFDCVLNNDIMSATESAGFYWEQESGFTEEDEEQEVFQWFIVDDTGADILKDIGEVVYYNADLDMHLWGVTHFGTRWDYVLTDVPINCE